MLTRKAVIEDASIWFDDEKNHSKYYKGIRFGFYNLPQGGTLVVDMVQLEFADDLFLFDIFPSLQALHGGMVEGKHLLLYKPNEQVLQGLVRVFDSVRECFMHMDGNGVIRPAGVVFSGLTRKSFCAMLELERHNAIITPEDIRKHFKANGPLVFVKIMKRLEKWGLIIKKEIPGKRGHRKTGYYPYHLLDPRFLPENVRKSSWDTS